jgi:hypothetical protein
MMTPRAARVAARVGRKRPMCSPFGIVDIKLVTRAMGIEPVEAHELSMAELPPLAT